MKQTLPTLNRFTRLQQALNSHYANYKKIVWMARVTRTERNGHWGSGRIRPVGDHCSFYPFWIRGYSLRFIGSVIYSLMPVRQTGAHRLLRQIIKPPIVKKNITLYFGKGLQRNGSDFFHTPKMSLRTRFFRIQTNIVWFVTNRKNSS